MKLLIVFVVALVAVLLLFAGLGIKMLLRRHGEFRRACAGHDPYTGAGSGCSCAVNKACSEPQRHPYQPLTVNDTLLEAMHGDDRQGQE